MILILGLKGVQYNLKNDTIIDEFFTNPIILDIPEHTDKENLDEILEILAREWFFDEDRKKEFKKMIDEKVNVDYFIVNIMIDGVVYSFDDPIYRDTFNSIGIIFST